MQALHILLQAKRANLGLERPVPLGFEHLHFLAQLAQVLAIAVITAGNVAGHGVPVSTKQPIERQLALLPENIPHGDINRGRGQQYFGFAPAFFSRDSLPGQ